MSKVIKVQIKNVYGNETVYPACPNAVRFAKLAGTRTLTTDALRLIAGLGYEIAVEAPTVRIAL
jgi:hypothetical protein